MQQEPAFSLVFQSFNGSIHALREVFQQAFGWAGCYASLAWDRESKHRPCELAANLPEADALAKAALLQQAGVQVTLVPTANMSNVDIRHRATECWPTHIASNGEAFTLLGNIILKGCSLNAPEQLRESQKEPDFVSWEFELSYNHEHPSTTLDRAGLQAARKCGAELAFALQECFPDRAFLLSYRCEQISFCQLTEELPVGITPGARRVDDLRVPPYQPDRCFCESCQSVVGYELAQASDSEFPHAQFARCHACGAEVVLWVDDETVLIKKQAADSR